MANEKRLDLIDRKALGIGYCNPLVFDKIEYAHGWNCAIEILMNAPTVDAVEVVRCKDCKHWECWRISGEGSGNCLLDVYGNLWNGNDYCSYGERRTDEGKADCVD